MSTWRITYRKLSGQVASVIITAATEREALSQFYAKYDGRVIDVAVLS